MGQLVEVGHDTTIVLEPEYLVGRGNACSLRVVERYVSAQHALLRWAQGRWELKDLGSLNGTFLDGTRVGQGTEAALRKGSRIAFGRVDRQWELTDDSAPRAMVVPPDDRAPIVIEGDILVLPSEEDPRFTLYRDDAAWLIEQPNESTTPISNGHVFEIEGRPWRFCCPENVWPTTLATTPSPLELRHLRLLFSVSRDEEFVDLQATCGETKVSLGARGFNYLLLTLARRRLADAEEGLSEPSCGWVHQEDFGHDPSMAPPQLNINVFRIRRHFEASGIADAALIVERRPQTRQLRIGTSQIEIVQL